MKGLIVEVSEYRNKEREIHKLLKGRKGYTSEFYCGANDRIDILTKDGRAIIPCVDYFEKYLNSKGIEFIKIDLSIIKTFE